MANIVLGVSSGIAAYKSVDLMRMLQRAGHEVRVVMTQNATRFVGPETFAALSGHQVGIDVFGREYAAGLRPSGLRPLRGCDADLSGVGQYSRCDHRWVCRRAADDLGARLRRARGHRAGDEHQDVAAPGHPGQPRHARRPRGPRDPAGRRAAGRRRRRTRGASRSSRSSSASSSASSPQTVRCRASRS